MSNFSELLAELGHGEPLSQEAEEGVTPAETQEVQDPPDGEGKDEQGTLSEEPESEAEGDTPEGEPGESESEPPAVEEDSERKPVEEPEPKAEDEEPYLEVDGEKVTLSRARELLKSGLRLEDYTRKTMDVARQREEALKREQEIRTLAQDISKDKALQQFLSARPEALAHLMADPKSARSLIGNPKGVEEFWTDYDVIRDNPRLAQKIYERPDEGKKELQITAEQRQMQAVVTTLDSFVDYVGREAYPGLDAEPVKEYIVSLAGLPDEPTHEDQVNGVTRIFNLFYRQGDNGQWTIDPRLIQTEFERLKMSQPVSDEPDDKEVAEHNRKVDEQLKTDDRPPKTPGGRAPAAGAEKPFEAKSFQEVLAALQG